jgi:hypothetical protein
MAVSVGAFTTSINRGSNLPSGLYDLCEFAKILLRTPISETGIIARESMIHVHELLSWSSTWTAQISHHWPVYCHQILYRRDQLKYQSLLNLHQCKCQRRAHAIDQDHPRRSSAIRLRQPTTSIPNQMFDPIETMICERHRQEKLHTCLHSQRQRSEGSSYRVHV